MASIGKVSAVFTASTSGLTAGVKSAQSSMRGLQAEARGLRSSMSALAAITGAQLFGSVVSAVGSAASAMVSLGKSAAASLTDAVNEATSLGEETSKSAVIFGDASGAVAKFAAEASKIGLSTSAALQATGAFGNLFVAMGLGRDQAASYATTLTSLGADLASFNNTSVEDAITAIGAALRGEAEPIRRFGVLLDGATLKQQALSMGLIATAKDALTPAIKAQAAYGVILKQTALAQGDFARTSGSLANLGRIVSAQSINVFATIGKTFTPLYTALASAAANVFSAIGPLLEKISGGVQRSVEVISAAITNLIPRFTEFLGSIDGQGIGENIGAALLSGASVLAAVGDTLIANSSAVFQYFADVGTRWFELMDLGVRVAQAFYGAFKLFEFVGNTVAGALSDLGGLLNGLFARIAAIIPGAQKVAAELRDSASGWSVQADKYLEAANSNLAASGAAFSAAFASGAASSLPAATGPLTSALQSAAAAAAESVAKSGDQAAGAITGAAPKPVKVEQEVKIAGKPVDVNQTVTVDVKEAIKGIDSRTSEGIAEMYRIIRGDTGNVQEQQLAALEEIAANTSDFEPLPAVAID